MRSAWAEGNYEQKASDDESDREDTLQVQACSSRPCTSHKNHGAILSKQKFRH
jgi:hypothetical protein